MTPRLSRTIALATLAWGAALAHAGTITVTSPTEGQFVGLTNSLSFIVRGARVKTNVQAVVTGPNGSTTIQRDYTPDVDGQIVNSLPLSFSEGSAQGQYTIAVTATETGNTYAPQTVTVNVDTLVPKLLAFSPVRGAFVRGRVPIRFSLLEANLKETRVQINGQDIPNNTGASPNVEVTYDTSGVQDDGPQTIALTATDLADNTLTRSINVTLDRNAPVTAVQYPLQNTPIRRGADVAIIVDVNDQFADAMDVTGVDVTLQTLDGVFLARASRLSFRNVGGNTFRWTGRLRTRQLALPRSFKLVVSAVDKAGNTAVRQEVTVRS